MTLKELLVIVALLCFLCSVICLTGFGVDAWHYLHSPREQTVSLSYGRLWGALFGFVGALLLFAAARYLDFRSLLMVQGSAFLLWAAITLVGFASNMLHHPHSTKTAGNVLGYRELWVGLLQLLFGAFILSLGLFTEQWFRLVLGPPPAHHHGQAPSADDSKAG